VHDGGAELHPSANLGDIARAMKRKHLFDVGAAAKVPAGSRDDDASNLVSLRGRLEMTEELLSHSVSEAIMSDTVLKRDDGDIAIHLEQNVSGHPSVPITVLVFLG
jgi:hypothetical protein